MAGFTPSLTAISQIPTLHLAQFKASSFSKPTLLLSFSTCIFTSSLVILASSCPSLQTPMLFSKHAYHPSTTHAGTISLRLPLPSEALFPSIPTSPLCIKLFICYNLKTYHSKVLPGKLSCLSSKYPGISSFPLHSQECEPFHSLLSMWPATDLHNRHCHI